MQLVDVMGNAVRLQGRVRPASIACSAGGRDITFEALDQRANRIANGLIAAGCRPGARVAALTRNIPEFIEILCGSLKAATVLLPVNWRLAPGEVRYILEHAQVEAMFVEEDLLPNLSQSAEILGGARAVIVVGRGSTAAQSYETWCADQAGGDPAVPADAGDVFIQMYTSGTTGLPKGVQLTHRNYNRSFEAMEHHEWSRTGAGEVVFAPAPFFHVNGVNGLLRSLISGSRLITVDQFRPAQVVEIFERERVTRAAMAPAMLQMCLEVPGIAERDFSALKLITYGGSPITERVLVAARDTFKCAFAQGYGMTETTSAVCMLAPVDHADGRGKLQSCGQPLPGIGVKVVSPDGAACAVGEVGEVVVQGGVVTPGYYRNLDATDRTIVEGWLHTGDAGYFDAEGYLYIHDRVKDMIVSGGENVYPAEVENALFRNPDVADAAVIGVPDARWGEAVKAIVVLRPGALSDEAAIIRQVREHIAGYKAPKSVDFAAAIPRNLAGKILRRELREPFWAGHGRSVN
jgi:acyl-CoA synthetase (AMP-forming)/AMP-acid ligase II